MNFEFSSPQLSELEQMVTNLFTNQKCNCHFINPSKTRILLWKQTKDHQTIYHLRIGIQKFISQSCSDRNGETYWKFDLPEKRAELVEVNKKSELPTPEIDPITKFNHRQEQAQNGKPNPAEQSVNHSPAS